MLLKDVFDAAGIKDSRTLDTRLGEMGEKAYVHDHEHRPDGFRGNLLFAEQVTRYLLGKMEESFALTRGEGVHQFSLLGDELVTPNDVRKATLLANTSTVFVSSPVMFDTWSEFCPDDASTASGEGWKLSARLVRSLFKHRRIIDAGLLRIVPTEISFRYTWTDSRDPVVTTPATAGVLADLEAIRITQSALPLDLLNRLTSHYANGRQLVNLPEIRIPIIDGIKLDAILRVREECDLEFKTFQRAYHRSLASVIAALGSSDFDYLSRQVFNELVVPELARIERKYRRIRSKSRLLSASGSTVGVAGITGILVSSSTLTELIREPPLRSGLIAGAAGLIAHLTTNSIHTHTALGELKEEEEYYILWSLSRRRLR